MFLPGIIELSIQGRLISALDICRGHETLHAQDNQKYSIQSTFPVDILQENALRLRFVEP